MIEPLLKSQLEPIARRLRRWRRARALAACWAVAALVGLAVLLGRPLLGDSLRWAMPALIGLSVLATAILWRRIGRWQPDYRSIARQIEQKHPELHALLLTAVEQQPDPASGQLHFLQERVVSEAVAESQRQHWIDTVSDARLFSWRLAQLATLGVLVFVVTRMHTTALAPS